MENTKSNYLYVILFLLLGAVLGTASFLLPFKYLIVLIGAACFGLLTFFQLNLSVALFLMGMLIIPNEYWNNLYITLAAVFFSGVYTLEWFLNKRDGIKLKYIAPSLVIYVLFCVISLFTGFGGMDSIRVFAIAFGCILFAVLLPHLITDEKILRLFILIIFIGITISSLYGLYQYMMGIEIKPEFTDLAQSQGLARLFSSMANSNNDAEVWVMFLPYCIAYLLLTKNDLKKVIFAGMIGLCVIAVLLTYSRSGFLAFAGGIGIFVLLVEPKLVPVGLMAGILLIPFLPQSVVDRLLTIGKDTSSKYRLYIWEGVLRMVKDYWIQGIGMGPSAFAKIYKTYAHSSAGPAMHSHNVYLSVLVETGIGGFIAFIAYLLRVFKEAVSSAMKPVNLNVKVFAAAGAASLTGFMIFSLVEYVWFYPRVMLCFWISMGLIHSIYRINGGQKG